MAKMFFCITCPKYITGWRKDNSHEHPVLYHTASAGTGTLRAQLLDMAEENFIRNNLPWLNTFIIQTAVKHVIHASSWMSVEQLSRHYNLSRRQFERKFAEYAGFSPKFYSRIIRFQAALAQYGNGFRSLTDIAYECGYYDQSHFIHDFKEFSGYHPGQYFHGRPEGIEYREV